MQIKFFLGLGFQLSSWPVLQDSQTELTPLSLLKILAVESNARNVYPDKMVYY